MLEEYARKRKFSRTPEPAPSRKRPTSSAGLFFCVQRHDASRLHYDFRLEVDGVLKSWAVPKGPSLDPSIKHLAAHVEDHPLEYGNFEGNIPKGEYGGGSVMLWDRGTYELLDAEVAAQKQLERGDFKFRLHGEKLNGDFALVHMKNRGKGNEWLLIKKRDDFAQPNWNVEEHAWSVLSGRTQEEIAHNLPAHEAATTEGESVDPGAVWTKHGPGTTTAPASAQTAATKKAALAVVPAKTAAKKSAKPRKSTTAFDPAQLEGARRAPMPDFFEPMSATIAKKPPAQGEWLFEVKWDGVRALCFVDNGQLRIYSRTGHRREAQYPELTVLPHFVAAKQAVLDGEIAVLDKQGVSRFELIQPRIANSDPAAVARMAHRTPVTLFLFDVVYLDGYDLRQVALSDRRRALQAVVTETNEVRLSQSFAGSGEQLLGAARENGLEGIVAKHANSCYESRRSREWQKIKLVNEQEFLICGFTEGEREHFGSLILGVHERGKVVYVGNVGTGFTVQSARDLFARLEPLITQRSPFDARTRIPGATWVRPELVAMVKFSNWTRDNRLRAPVFLGLRDDVKPEAVHREAS